MKFLCSTTIILLASIIVVAQNNPVPFINNPLVPASLPRGGFGFTLTVNGTGFISGAVVTWNGGPRSTQLISSSQLTASILPADIARARHSATASLNIIDTGGGSPQQVKLTGTGL